jgi:hypothetical protein
MPKGEFSYPVQAFDVSSTSEQKNFNVSGKSFEYALIVKPESFASGEYRVNTWLEEAYQPPAFEFYPNNS